MSSWVKLGAKCVCVRLPIPDLIASDCMNALPVIGKVYTVNDISTSPRGLIVIGCAELDQTVYYDAQMFRPVVPPKAQEDDIALFRHLLQTTPAGVDA